MKPASAPIAEPAAHQSDPDGATMTSVGQDELAAISVTVNGTRTELQVRPDELLIDVLRDRLQLTGTKLGCGVGMCGACSVLLDDVLVSGCLTPAVLLDDRSVVTVEGLTDAAPALAAALREAFDNGGGYQCGICTPGQLVSAVALLRHNPRPCEAEIRGHLAANLCRCTGYAGIIAAIGHAAEQAPVP